MMRYLILIHLFNSDLFNCKSTDYLRLLLFKQDSEKGMAKYFINSLIFTFKRRFQGNLNIVRVLKGFIYRHQ
jgi:hypothetical protein